MILNETITYSAAFIAGLLSFFSPCILPLIPAYFTFITGFTLDELTGGIADKRKKVIFSTIAYVSGFSTVFILMGASASYLGSLIHGYGDIIRIAGGVIIMLLGLHLTGWFRFGTLEFEKRIHVNKKSLGFLGTYIVGMAFAAGWSPCIGPLLGSILIIAGSKDSSQEGVALLSLYSAGLALPFIGMSFFINAMLSFMKKASPALRYFNSIAGVLLIIIGFLLIINKLIFLTI